MAITRRQIKEIKSLSTKRGRRAQNRFLAEGVRLLEETVIYRWLPEMVLISRTDLSERGERLVASFQKQAIRIEEIAKKDFESISTTESPQGILAVFAMPRWELKQLYGGGFRKILWCENVTDPGNVGTLARSALAFGFSAMLLSGRSVEPFAPKVIRSSAGAIFGLRVLQCGNDDVLKFAAETDGVVIAADVEGKPVDYLLNAMDKPSKLILAIGAEAEGLSDEVLAAAGFRVRIQHSEKVESLNAAMAGSILMSRIYEMNRENR
ncbi:MAG TPA: RNA methyltransferase [candidate division Zixibacteria bacterium]|nr:RNA methyltransferase [candidate division Zixibacteria bacterium]